MEGLTDRPGGCLGTILWSGLSGKKRKRLIKWSLTRRAPSFTHAEVYLVYFMKEYKDVNSSFASTKLKNMNRHTCQSSLYDIFRMLPVEDEKSLAQLNEWSLAHGSPAPPPPHSIEIRLMRQTVRHVVLN
jgi:hypothetical protein